MGYDYAPPFETGLLKVSDVHTLHLGESRWESCDLPPWWPGSWMRCKESWVFQSREIQSCPPGSARGRKIYSKRELVDNTTWDLVSDIERLREHLEIERWHVFGGSWGSTLALAYAQTHPEHVKTLVLRGMFVGSKSETLWLFQDGASHIFPEAWDDFCSLIPEAERGDLVSAYNKRLTSSDEETRLAAAKAWATWESSTVQLRVDPGQFALANSPTAANAMARIECHYFINDCFMREGQLLEDEAINRVRHIPIILVHGRYDICCPPSTAQALKKRSSWSRPQTNSLICRLGLGWHGNIKDVERFPGVRVTVECMIWHVGLIPVEKTIRGLYFDQLFSV
ncbi:Alpha/Beta hydrolase protein [Gloeopeniophorella convolvens]|nr:Alpha/Beta hydrolase protein [Gloeopeniophorella convolvens]